MKNINWKQRRGMTLVEVLVALAITGLIGAGIATSIVQMFDINHQNTNAITAQRQVQQAGFYISRDGQNAQSITTGSNPTGTGFSVVFSWTEWNGTDVAVTYSLSNDGVITRSEARTLAGETTTTPPRNIAENISISAADTIFQTIVGSPGFYSLKITATIAGKFPVSETRTYEIRQRTV